MIEFFVKQIMCYYCYIVQVDSEVVVLWWCFGKDNLNCYNFCWLICKYYFYIGCNLFLLDKVQSEYIFVFLYQRLFLIGLIYF